MKSLRTIRALLFNPGSLTREFVSGRRASYVSPIRLYIFASFLFFLIVNIIPDKESAVLSTGGQATEQSVSGEFKISALGLSSEELKGLSVAQVDSLMDARGIERTLISRYFVVQAARIATFGTKEFGHRLLKGISYMMFVLMPVFALFIYWLYRKQVGYYLNCLILSIHFHSAAFILLTVLFTAGRLFDFSALLLSAPFLLGVYGLLAVRRFAPQSWSLAFFKTFVLGIVYVLALTFIFLLTVTASVLTY